MTSSGRPAASAPAAASGSWVPSGPVAQDVHHILLDDHIRSWTSSSIVDPRFMRLGGGEHGSLVGGPCPQEAAERLGCIVPVAPERIILEPDGFVRAVIGHANRAHPPI
ncbi:unnamed protein product [Prorocentrum cordatum]|uniref:Uncharacterized protein n=1 Tax=Prorocentrum cordatum TaxID=2364126 RepID=A0ABN9SZ35_9DINO|nr:unnamed protein product [Polarella glacialis]